MVTLITLQYINIGLILIALALSLAITIVYKKFWWWSIPIFVLLIHGLVFRIILAVDLADGVVNENVYNVWSDLLHMQDKITIIIYALAILTQRIVLRRKGENNHDDSQDNLS